MIGFLFDIANISGGILLGLVTLDKWDGDQNFFNKIAGFLAPFQTAIGGVLVIIGLLRLFRGYNLIFNILSVLGGFLLLTHVLGKAPAFKSVLEKFSDQLMPFKVIIGLGIIVVGLLGLF